MAAFYFLNTGDSNWSNGVNWSASDGGAPVNALPTSADDVFLTANSGDVTQDFPTTHQQIKTFTCTGYTKTLTLLYRGIYVFGNIVLSNQMKIITNDVISAFLLIASSGTVKSNGVIIPSFRTGINDLTITLLDQLNVSRLLYMASSVNTIWDGNFGFITSDLYNSNTAGNTVTFRAGNTYKVYGTFAENLQKGTAHGKIISSTPGTKANLIVTGDINVGYVDFTDIDASGGRTIYTFNGVVTNCNNIVSMTDRILPINSTNAASFII